MLFRGSPFRRLYVNLPCEDNHVHASDGGGIPVCVRFRRPAMLKKTDMFLDKEDIKRQTRELWHCCFDDTDDFLDVYFEEKYSDEANLTVRQDGRVVAAGQMLPYQMLFYGVPLHAGYLSGLCVHPDVRGRGLASRLIREGHRRLYRQGAALSFLIPGDEALRAFYELPQHGAYWTAVFREEQVLAGGDSGGDVEVSAPDDWGRDLYVFFRRNTVCPFMLRPAENDFFAALAACDRADGMVLVARRKQRLCGICLAVREADGRVFVRSMSVLGEAVSDAFLHHLRLVYGVAEIYARMPVSGEAPNAVRYAMARVVDAKRFLGAVASVHPDFRLHIGVDGDLDVPENNGYYLVADGHVRVTDRRPDCIVTPGGLAALLLGAQPTWAGMLLDE